MDKKYYDPKKERLLLCQTCSTPEFWDKIWSVGAGVREELLGTKNTYVSVITKRYLSPEAGPILEGGCGRGGKVASLFNDGYEVTGIDYAESTVKALNEHVPELDIRLGDVRNVSFCDNTFAGYWSVGVIEHFFEGYDSIADEMERVLVPGGYLFLTFPYMSPLRKLKARLGMYEDAPSNCSIDDFYQFMLNGRTVINDFRKRGFELVSTAALNPIKGAKDEIAMIKPVFQPLFDYNGKNRVKVFMIKILSKILEPFACESLLLVLRKGK